VAWEESNLRARNRSPRKTRADRHTAPLGALRFSPRDEISAVRDTLRTQLVVTRANYGDVYVVPAQFPNTLKPTKTWKPDAVVILGARV